jgi:hypothetical protein
MCHINCSGPGCYGEDLWFIGICITINECVGW